eukprot:TRINITY_DN12908_c0_g1_i1.p1 TRINITY_DN12908_c0_g1~~TRINITY_DN12908_c0_g1_i1.p1  ORF type:complete len:127 (-),score=22.07 TRINITY_DN12908_c0_g1_i1:85-465(-)
MVYFVHFVGVVDGETCYFFKFGDITAAVRRREPSYKTRKSNYKTHNPMIGDNNFMAFNTECDKMGTVVKKALQERGIVNLPGSEWFQTDNEDLYNALVELCEHVQDGGLDIHDIHGVILANPAFSN